MRAAARWQSLREAQDMLDCEISLGSVAVSRWMIEESSLPFRVGWDLRPISQTAQTFHYLKERLARGETVLPGGALAPASFGQQARLREEN